MPDKISFVIPCEAQWVEGIYRLETSDRVLGYDPETGEDGAANRQWKELGDRTLYLKAIEDATHTDGHHQLTNADFAEGTKIPESALQLHHGTDEIHACIEQLRTDTNAAKDTIETLTDVNLSYTSVLTVLMPYSREYFKTNTDYELFTDAVKLRSFGHTTIAKEIAGDDSIDVENAAGIEPGKTYFLMDYDGNNVEEVTVLAVLTDNRIRLNTNCVHTRNSGYMATTTLLPQDGVTTVYHAFTYITAIVDTLSDADYGKLFVHRDACEVTDKKVYYCRDGSNSWLPAEYVGQENFYDGTVDDVFKLPSGLLKLRIDYGMCEQPYKLYYFVVKGISEYISIENICRPVIQTVTVQDDIVTVTGSPYASLWGIEQNAIQVRILREDEYTPEVCLTTAYGDSTHCSVQLPPALRTARPLRVQLKYIDVEATQSRWSEGYVLTE